MSTPSNQSTTLQIDNIYSTSTFWGGLSGSFELINNDQDLSDYWTFNFQSKYNDFDFYNAEEISVLNSDGTYTITVSAPTGSSELQHGGRLNLDFTVNSTNDPEVSLTEVMLVVQADENSEIDSIQNSEGTSSGNATDTQDQTDNINTNTSFNDGSSADETSSGEIDADMESDTDLVDSTNGLSVSIELGSHWQGTYEGVISVLNSGDEPVQAGWSVSFISSHALSNITDFQIEQVARSDGRFMVTLSAPIWAIDQEFAAAESRNSYFQAEGDLNGLVVEELFEMNVGSTADSPSEPVDDSTADVPAGPVDDSTADVPAGPVDDSTADVPAGPADDSTADSSPNSPINSDGMRIVGYFEEWGIYGRDFLVSDIKADTLTHVNYSFFGITPTEADKEYMSSDLNVMPGGWVNDNYQGLNSNDPGALGIHDPWAAYEKTFSQSEQLVSRTFSAEEWAELSQSRKTLYTKGGDFVVSGEVNNESSDPVVVTARADTYRDSQGGLQRTFTAQDWDALSEARQAYLVNNQADYSWTDQWQGNFNAAGSSSAEKIESVDAHFAEGPGRSLSLTADGDLLLDDSAWNDADKQAWEKLYAGNLNQMRRLSELNPELNIGFAIGGWTLSGNFSTNLSDAAGRERFTDSIIDHLEYYDFFNTVDFDWEYPGGGGLDTNAAINQDGENFALTLSMLDSKLEDLQTEIGREVEISIATAGGAEKLANLNLQGIDPHVDFYNVMTYDFHGGWEPETGHQAAMTGDAGGYDVLTAIEQFETADVAMDKVVLGAPAYTRAWGNVSAGDSFGYQQSGEATAAPGSYEKGNYDYKDLITGIENGTHDLIWDDDSKAAFTYNSNDNIWSSIETTATISGKAEYIQDKGLGGMMFWALSNDSDGEQSLITAAHDVLVGGADPSDVVARGPEFDHVLGGDGIFSTSDFTTLI